MQKHSDQTQPHNIALIYQQKHRVSTAVTNYPHVKKHPWDELKTNGVRNPVLGSALNKNLQKKAQFYANKAHSVKIGSFSINLSFV